MSSAIDALIPQISNYNPAGFVQQNQLRQQQIGLNAAQQAQMQQETALRQQQTQAAGLENQMRQQQLRDSQILRDAYANHADADWSDPQTQASFEKDLVKNGISYPGLSGYRSQALKWQQDLQGLDENRLKIEDTLNQRTADILQGYKDIPDAQKPQIWAQVTAPALNGLHRGQFDPTNPLVGSALDSVIGTVAHHKQMVEDAKNVQETKTSAATAAEAGARTEETKLKTQVEQHQLELYDLLSKNPANLQQRVAKSIDPQQFPQEYQAAVNEMQAQPDYKSMMSVLEKHSQNVSEQVRQKSLETDPQILAAKRKQVELQASYENALRQGDEANKEYYESAVGFNTTKAAAQSIQKVVELAQSGNPAAAQQLKALMPEFTNAMMDIKRLGGGQNDKNFTSAFDTAMDTASSILKGQPFTPSTLQQVMPYIRTITNGAAQKHNAIVDTVNATYKKNYQHEAVPYQDVANPKTPTGAARKVGDQVTLKGGRTVRITKIYPDGSFDY